MSKKVILIHPSDDTKSAVYPLSCLYLSGYIMKYGGYEPVILDHNDEKDYEGFLKQHIKDAICVGISSLTGTQIRYGLKMSHFIKSINPEIPIIWGGHHPTACPEQTVSDPRIDIVVRNEGEVTFLELVQTLEKEGSLDGVKGITYKSNGKVINNPPRPPMDLSEMPDIPWYLIDIERKLRNSIDKFISIQSGRGCPFNCTFCSLEKTMVERYKMFTPEYIIRNLEPIIRKYQIKNVTFFEPHFITNKQKVRTICTEFINKKFDIRWTGTARTDTFIRLDSEDLNLLSKSGCNMVTFGVESGSPEVLKRTNKKAKVEHAVEAAKLCYKYSLTTMACFMIGFPFEMLKDMWQTLKLISTLRHLNPNIIINVQTYTTYPGTLLYKECVERYGLKVVSSLEEWGRLEWIHDRPWIRGWKKLFIRIVRASSYASSKSYIKECREKSGQYKKPIRFIMIIFLEILYFLQPFKILRKKRSVSN